MVFPYTELSSDIFNRINHRTKKSVETRVDLDLTISADVADAAAASISCFDAKDDCDSWAAARVLILAMISVDFSGAQPRQLLLRSQSTNRLQVDVIFGAD